MIRVLIADDAALLRERLLVQLKQIEGISSVSEAIDCAGALAAIEQEHPDLVVLDFNMPDGSGLDVLHGITLGQHRPRVFILSAFGDEEVRKRCLDLGAEKFFDKSSDFLATVEAIREIAAESAA